MKITEIKVGEEYAIRRGGVGSRGEPGRVRVEAIEPVQVRTYGNYSMHGRMTTQKLARVTLLDGYYSPSMGVPDAPGEKERYARSRDFLCPWSEAQEGIDARAAVKREQDAADALAQGRFAGITRRLEQLKLDEPRRADRYAANTHVELTFDAVEALLEKVS